MVRPIILLINENRMRPPVAPVALDYLAASLTAWGYGVEVLDLCWSTDPRAAVVAALERLDPVAIGISFRNTDDCYLPSGAWFVPRLVELVGWIQAVHQGPVILGGCGYSLFGERILEMSGADFGILGDGEFTFPQLIAALRSGRDPRSVPGLVYRDAGGRIVSNPRSYRRELEIPPGRRWVDNARYFREGGMGGVESKRGCPHPCIYCADPVARGRVVRCRPPAEVAEEIEQLLGQGVEVLHLCDGEFNVPPDHARAICAELTRRKLGERLRWYAYATVQHFPVELAEACRRAGCVGLNFGVDSACDRILAGLGRGYRREAIAEAVRACRRAGITVMLDLVIGGPGECPETVADSFEFLREVDPDCIGANTGVRIYPGTALARLVRAQGPMESNPDLHGQVRDNASFLRPVFFIDRRLGPAPLDLVVDLIAGDPRFFPPPRGDRADNYNYNDNRVLCEAIAAGGRGAFWDILRRLRRC